jgi:hypothetical protein
MGPLGERVDGKGCGLMGDGPREKPIETIRPLQGVLKRRDIIIRLGILYI